MDKRNHLLEVADLKAVASYEDELVLFIDSEDPNIPTSLCVEANFGTLQFGPVQPMAVYLEAGSYQHVHDADRRISYRQRIKEEMNPDVITAMLRDFNQKRWLILEKPVYPSDDHLRWKPGG